MNQKLPIGGSATLDSAGIFVTEKGAIRFARQSMPRDLKAAGFVAGIVRGQEAFEGRYRDCWRVNYGK
jgi:hypothetical protein